MKPLYPWIPDSPNYPNTDSLDVNNVVVRTANQAQDGLHVDYSPFPAPAYVPTPATLSNYCQGLFTAKDVTDNVYTFAGDLGNLYTVTTTATPINKVTITSGVTSSYTYATPTDAQWSFSQYGPQVIATNGVDNPQYYTIGTSTIFADIPSAPLAKFTCTIKDFLVLACPPITPNQLQWSSIDQPLSWPTPGTNTAIQNQSDIQIMPDGSSIMGVVGGVAGIDGLVFTEKMVYRMQYEGYPTVFGFYPVDRSKGCVASGSIINQGQFVAYLSQDGFYIFNGTNVQPIGAGKIDKWFWSNVNQEYISRISVTYDPVGKNIIWSFPSTITSSTNTTPDKALIYNWQYNEWTKADLSTEIVSNAFAQGLTLEQLDSYGTLDSLPFSLDSRVWKSGSPLFITVNPANHSIGSLGSITQDSYVITDAELADGGVITYYSSVRPITDAPTYQACVATQHQLSDQIVYGALSTVNSNGECLIRASGRYVYTKILIPNGTSWTHLSGYEVSSKPLGKR